MFTHRLVIIAAVFFAVFALTVPVGAQGAYQSVYVDGEMGQDTNVCSRTSPCKTIKRGLEKLGSLSNPRQLLISPGVYNNYVTPEKPTNKENILSLKKIHGTKEYPVIIKSLGGPNEHVMIEGWTEPGDMVNNPKHYQYAVIDLTYCSFVRLENIRAVGGGEQTLKIESSHDLEFVKVHATKPWKRGAFLVGKLPTPYNIVFKYCVFGDTLNGNGSHAFYASAGHWKANEPAHDIYFYDCEFWGGMRCGLQFNGNFKNILIERNVFHHNYVAGVTIYSAKNVYMNNNIFYENCRAPIILRIYFDDKYWDEEDPESRKEWLLSHPPIENVLIENNTIHMPESQFWQDEDHGDTYLWKDYSYPGILLNMEKQVKELFPKYPDHKYVRVRNNIIANYTGLFIASDGVDLNATGNEYHNNLGFDYDGGEMFVSNVYEGEEEWMNLSAYQDTHDNWLRNQSGNPLFKETMQTAPIQGKPNMYDYAKLIPLYKKDSGYNMHILSESSAIGKGGRSFAVMDFDHLRRRWGKRIDAGAYEYRRNKKKKTFRR